jgi:hypothetical protein
MSHLLMEERARDSGKLTRTWDVLAAADRTRLGTVKWWTHWRRYVFFPEPERLFDAVCLQIIANYLELATSAQKEDQKQRRWLRKEARDALKETT